MDNIEVLHKYTDIKKYEINSKNYKSTLLAHLSYKILCQEWEF
jgi:hypothetical protein